MSVFNSLKHAHVSVGTCNIKFNVGIAKHLNCLLSGKETQTMLVVGVAKALWRHMTNDQNHSHDPQRPKTIIKRFLSEKCLPANQTTVRRLLDRDLLLRSPTRLPKQLELQQNGLLWTHKRLPPSPPFRHIENCFNAFDLDLLSDLRFVTVRGASFNAALCASKKITFHPPWPFRACHSSA